MKVNERKAREPELQYILGTPTSSGSDINEGMYRMGGKDTCDDGLSRRSLGVHFSYELIELESKNDDVDTGSYRLDRTASLSLQSLKAILAPRSLGGL